MERSPRLTKGTSVGQRLTPESFHQSKGSFQSVLHHTSMRQNGSLHLDATPFETRTPSVAYSSSMPSDGNSSDFPHVPGELELIASIRRRAALRSPDLRLGIGDDCALIRVRPGEELAITTDLSVDGRHFRLATHPPEAVGHRTLARGLSDLAAMGARPVAAFLSLGLPVELTVPQPTEDDPNPKPWSTRFFDGLLALAAQHKTPLAGGDLCQTTQAAADIVLLGAVPNRTALLRSGAHPGDLLYITGSLGGSAVGLELLDDPAAIEALPPRARSKRLAPHLYPQPRLKQGDYLRRRKLATAAIDLSDGLSTDLHHLCRASGVSAEVNAALLPIAPGATLEQALHGGEDYELLFTVPPDIKVPASIAGVPLTRIGCIMAAHKSSPAVSLLSFASSEPLLPRGWQHFI